MADAHNNALRAPEVVAAAVSNAATLALLTRPAAGAGWTATLCTLLLSAASAATLVVAAVGLYRLLSGGGASRRSARARWIGLASTAGLLVSVIAAAGIGQASALVAGLAAMGAVSYAAFARFLPAVGVVSLGLLAGASMLVADPRLGPVWPVMLTMTHVMACAAARVSSRHRRPGWRGRDTLLAVAGWCFWSLVWLGVSPWRAGGAEPASTGLWLAVGVAVAFATAALIGRGAPMRSAWALRVMHAYNAAWLLGLGDIAWALLPIALGTAAWAAGRHFTPPSSPSQRLFLRGVRNES
ncbi:MAG: hypothetical protein AAF586_09925 [Planctomycetota bacterium]